MPRRVGRPTDRSFVPSWRQLTCLCRLPACASALTSYRTFHLGTCPLLSSYPTNHHPGNFSQPVCTSPAAFLALTSLTLCLDSPRPSSTSLPFHFSCHGRVNPLGTCCSPRLISSYPTGLAPPPISRHDNLCISQVAGAAQYISLHPETTLPALLSAANKHAFFAHHERSFLGHAPRPAQEQQPTTCP